MLGNLNLPCCQVNTYRQFRSDYIDYLISKLSLFFSSSGNRFKIEHLQYIDFVSVGKYINLKHH